MKAIHILFAARGETRELWAGCKVTMELGRGNGGLLWLEVTKLFSTSDRWVLLWPFVMCGAALHRKRTFNLTC